MTNDDNIPFKEGDLVTYIDENGSREFEGKTIVQAVYIERWSSHCSTISVVGLTSGHNGKVIPDSYLEKFKQLYGCEKNSYWIVPTRNLHFFNANKGDFMEIKHNAKIERRVDLLNDSRVLSLEIDEEARKLFSQFACQGEELVTNDNGIKRYRIKSVLSSVVGTSDTTTVFFSKELIDTGKATISLKTIPDYLDSQFRDIVRSCYALLKVEITNVTVNVERKDENDTTIKD